MHEIDRKLTPVNIYIDLSKAFDTLNIDILLYKLHYNGITDIGFNEIKTGAPQGSILGHLLFTIYINDLSTISNTYLLCMLMTPPSISILKIFQRII